MDVNEELKFFGNFTQKKFGGGGGGGGAGGGGGQVGGVLYNIKKMKQVAQWATIAHLRTSIFK